MSHWDDDSAGILRDSIRRYVEREIVPKAAAWEEQGFVPREVLREMGSLGFLGLRYAEEYGGAGLDARATALLAEELGRSSSAASRSRCSFTPTWPRRTSCMRAPTRRKRST